MNIYHFYHIWADGEWHLPVKEHIEFLKQTQLINVISSFEIGIIGKRNNRLRVKEFLWENDIKFNICVEKDLGFEHETLDKIVEFPEEDGYILYAHTKGSFNNKDFEHGWRRDMSKKLITNWKECVVHLKTHAAVCYSYSVANLSFLFVELENLVSNCTILFSKGTIRFPYGSFDGNFWWSHLRYIKLLEKVPRLNDPTYALSQRRFAENWTRNLCNVVFDDQFKVYQMSNNAVYHDNKIKTDKSNIKELIQDLIKKNKISKEDFVHIFFDDDKLNKSVIGFTSVSTLNKGNFTYTFEREFSKNFKFFNKYEIVK